MSQAGLNTAPFETYLRRRDYAEQTVTQTSQRAARLERLRATGMKPEALPLHWRSHLLRILAGAEEELLPAELGAFAQGCLEAFDQKRLARKRHGLRGGRRPKQRAKPARSVPDATWTRLLAWLEVPRQDPEIETAVAVLGLEAATGLRIGDILRIPVRDLAEGLANGRIELEQKGGTRRVLYVAGAPEAWKRLGRACRASGALRTLRPVVGGATNVASCVCVSDDVSSSGCAYKRCERLLKQAQKELGLDRLHTHRLRRTMAVQALRVTKDVSAVSEMLGHVPGSHATHGYIDEARPERVAELTQQVREKFGGRG